MRRTASAERTTRTTTHGGPPHESPWVVTRAADPAGDPVGLRRLGLHRADAVRRLLRRRRSSSAESHAVLARAAGGVARRRARSSLHGARERCRSGWRSPASPRRAYLLHRQPDAARRACSSAARRRSTRCSTTSTTSTASTTGSSPAARASRRRRVRRSATGASSTASSSTARRAWSAGLGADAPAAVRLHLPLRVHDDHRRLRAADLVGRALTRDDDVLSLPRHLGADRRRHRRCW